MAEEKVKVKITRTTFVNGDEVPKDSEQTLSAADARQLIRMRKAVPAGDQQKANSAIKRKI